MANEVLVHWRDLRVIEQETLRLAVCIALKGPEKFAGHVLLWNLYNYTLVNVNDGDRVSEK